MIVYAWPAIVICFADDVRITGEAALPKRVTDHDDARGIRLFILPGKTATEQRLACRARQKYPK